MNTPSKENKPAKWAPSASREVRTARPKWAQIRKGLDLAIIGHACFAVLLALGGAIVATQGGQIAQRADVTLEEATQLGWGVLALGVLVGYALVLLSQWRCLLHAPQANAAKDLL